MNKMSPEQAPRMDVNLAFDYELRQSQNDLNAYIDTRPYQDQDGQTLDSAGNVINPDEYFDQQREIHEAETSQTAYEDMGVKELARVLAQAEVNDDKTTQFNVTEVLEDKIEEYSKNIPDSDENYIVDENGDRNYNVTPFGITENRILKYKDKYKAELLAADVLSSQGKEEPSKSEKLIVTEEDLVVEPAEEPATEVADDIVEGIPADDAEIEAEPKQDALEIAEAEGKNKRQKSD